MATATLPQPAVDTDRRVPSFIDHRTRADAAALAAELQATRLEVGLQPAPHSKFTGHMVRVVHQHNPAWYERLCQRRPSSRTDWTAHFQTAVKRHDVLVGLRQLAHGYAGRLAADLLDTIAWVRAEADAQDAAYAAACDVEGVRS